MSNNKTRQTRRKSTRGNSGYRFKSEAKKIVEVLDLKWTPIAGKFSAKAGEKGDSSRKLRICEALDLVKHENLILTLSKDNCACAGGRHFSGMELVPIETFATVLTRKNHRVYESMDAALASIRKQPQPVHRGDFLTLGPLESFEENPDLVILFVNPAQADRVLGLASFKGAEPFMYYPASNICSTITNVMAKGRPETNLIATFERKARKCSPNELILAIPMKDFEAAVENIPLSGYGTPEEN